MDRSQATNLVRETFTQRFDEGRFALFIRNLVNRIDESKKQNWTLVKDAFKPYVNHFKRLGTYTDPRDERVDVLVIHLRKETTLARGRVTLRNFVADYLTTGHGQGKAAVIAAFVSPTEDDWRFSFVKLDYTLEKTELGIVTEKRELTPARRYSYLVGRNENCHTAQKQFLELLQIDKADPTVQALESAFSVEKVTKEFFEHYRELFEKTRRALKTFLKSSSPVASEFKTRGIEEDDFAKKLLGQIVFLYFLQKKGWFGVEKGKSWGSGRRDFIRYLFANRTDFAHLPGRNKREPNFFNDILEPLFYEALSAPRVDEDHYYRLFDCRIPFLNGGLFEPLYNYDWVNTDILLPDELFSNDEKTKEGDTGTGILDVFDRFNFTVNEAEPLEKEVAVDPEMLGKVFENLLPENIRHGIGTYYTPRVIVHYMCQQGLLHYLLARAPEVPREEIEAFLRLAERFADFQATDTEAHKEKRLPESIVKNAPKLDELLSTVTVCDPAIGSGAFPVGMMHEIVRARMALSPVLEGKVGKRQPAAREGSRSAYLLKRHAIHHCLYGVDIDPGAVEIAKLRLWLSMVVDEDEFDDIQPLPNLDYKIMQGNSLLEEYEGVSLFDDTLLEASVSTRDQEIERLEALKAQKAREYIQIEGRGQQVRLLRAKLQKENKQISDRIDELRSTGPDRQFALSPPTSAVKLKRLQDLHAEFFEESSRKKKEEIRKEINRLEWDFMRATLREQGKEDALDDLERAIAEHRKPFFLWKLQFSEVFQRSGGFDVVIANPPYVRQESITHLKTALASYVTYSGRSDLYVYFYELAVNILRDHGVLAFISSNKFFRANYGRGLRGYLLEGSTLREIIDFEDAPVFEATTYPCVVVLQKGREREDDSGVKVSIWDGATDIESFIQSIADRREEMKSNVLTERQWSLHLGKKALIYNRIEAIGTPLGNLLSNGIYAGIKTGLNDAFIIDSEKREQLISQDPASAEIIKPFLKGKDIPKWSPPARADHNRFIIYMPHGVEIGSYPAIRAHLAAYKERLQKRALNQEWYELQQPQLAFTPVFEGRKIVYPNVSLGCRFALDEGSYLDMTTFCLKSDDLCVLGVLNSTVMTFFFQGLGIQRRGGYQEFKTQYVRQLPIPPVEREHRVILESLVEYLVWLYKGWPERKNEGLGAKGMLIAGYFEQLVNALVYELFFPDELHKAGLHFFQLVESATLPRLTGKLDPIHEKFKEIYEPSHPIRQALYALDSIEEVRIIEGKA